MDLWDVAKVMWRRRWVAVPLLLLSVVAAIFALLTVPPDYTTKGVVAVLPPTVAIGPTATTINPYTADTLAEFVTLSLSRPEVKRQLIAEGLSGEYIITTKAFGLTLIDLAVSAKSPELVSKTLDRIIQMVRDEFVRHQAALKPGETITVDVIDDGTEIKVARTVGKRTLIVIVGVGLLVTVAISLWVDALVRRRVSRMPELPGVRAVVPVSPAVGLAAAAIPVAYTPNAANAATVSLANDSPDNDSTIVLPLAGVSWSKGEGGKRKSGDATGDAKGR